MILVELKLKKNRFLIRFVKIFYSITLQLERVELFDRQLTELEEYEIQTELEELQLYLKNCCCSSTQNLSLGKSLQLCLHLQTRIFYFYYFFPLTFSYTAAWLVLHEKRLPSIHYAHLYMHLIPCPGRAFLNHLLASLMFAIFHITRKVSHGSFYLNFSHFVFFSLFLMDRHMMFTLRQGFLRIRRVMFRFNACCVNRRTRYPSCLFYPSSVVSCLLQKESFSFFFCECACCNMLQHFLLFIRMVLVLGSFPCIVLIISCYFILMIRTYRWEMILS